MENQELNQQIQSRIELAKKQGIELKPGERFANQCPKCDSYSAKKNGIKTLLKGTFQVMLCGSCKHYYKVSIDTPVLPQTTSAYPCPHCNHPKTSVNRYKIDGTQIRECSNCGKKHESGLINPDVAAKPESHKVYSRFTYEKTSDGSEFDPENIRFKNFNDFLSWVRKQCNDANPPNDDFEVSVIITPDKNGKFNLEVYDDYRE